ncbi:cobalamin biosynthesis protein CobD [Chloroherpeton thalassium ATCC 35110]|uniref:Cobalamin biosynthesis protein CobD n=1 Tax=Chloroherpeton thalassium (strain ATCC 35110 / GB-78) TaxID=517418 RepID=B3QZ43_CHLT3|nr:adenosylcobinamide-phosphate synthase CbiB [Chloroherpeton thalassium]ACF13736.1 cobalamin biosynthesis protein CobD [Chloroherpeton thalassium ATCC 35110]
MDSNLLVITALWLGLALDFLLADPTWLPHPIVFFGNLIARGEKRLNAGAGRFLKGMLFSAVLIAGTFGFFFALERLSAEISVWATLCFHAVFVFYGVAGEGLIREGKGIFAALRERGLEAGRTQLSRIVGRETGELSANQIKIAVFESMSENLSDGVIAPLFYYALFGVPGIMAYKMTNTLDSMIGYRSERYEQFGKFAARLDDVLNFLPARLTALLMALASLSPRAIRFALKYGKQHKSPNSGYPEAALAGILNCRFGGPNRYHGELVEKPYIGETERDIQFDEIKKVAGINIRTMLLFAICFSLLKMAF